MIAYQLKDSPYIPFAELIITKNIGYLAAGVYAYLAGSLNQQVSFEEISSRDKFEHSSTIGVALEDLIDAGLIERIEIIDAEVVDTAQTQPGSELGIVVTFEEASP